MEAVIEKIKPHAISVRNLLGQYGEPLVKLGVRFMIAKTFFMAGLAKIQDWENTVFLFEFEYSVPVLPPEFAAFLATCFELGMPVLLLIGLFSRLASMPLLGMALVIQFILGAANPAYDNIEHFYWMLLLLVIITTGPGRLSLDHYLVKKFCPNA